MKNLLALAWVLLASFPALAQEAPTFPDNQGAVNDFANVLSTGTKDAIRSMAAKLRDTKGPCVVVVTTPSLYGLTVDEYTNLLFKKWKIGHKNDDGLIFLIATNERKMRIEVGYGLEPTIPDLIAKAILADKVKPFLKQDKWDEGVLAGTQAIISRLGGAVEGNLPEPAPILNQKPFPIYKPSTPWYLTWWGLILIVVGIILLIIIVVNDPTGLSGVIISGMINSSGSSGGGGGGGGGSRESSSRGGGDSGGGGASDDF